MKQIVLTTTMIIVALFLAVSASAESKGAMKAAFDPDVGWAIVNTTASGKLNITVHLNNGKPNEEFDISLRVRYEDGIIVPFTNIATLSTNSQGKGNAQVQVTIDPPAGSDALRRVAVRVRRPGPPNILYVATIWDIPLK